MLRSPVAEARREEAGGQLFCPRPGTVLRRQKEGRKSRLLPFPRARRPLTDVPPAARHGRGLQPAEVGGSPLAGPGRGH